MVDDKGQKGFAKTMTGGLETRGGVPRPKHPVAPGRASDASRQPLDTMVVRMVERRPGGSMETKTR